MELINWSLSAIDTVFSRRSTGSGEPACPDGMFAAGYTMDGWEKWRVVCLSALSVEDVEDIYLFGTLITGMLLIGGCFALVYQRIGKTLVAVQSPRKLPGLTEAVEKAISSQTGTINRVMETNMVMTRGLDTIMRKVTDLERKIDQLNS